MTTYPEHFYFIKALLFILQTWSFCEENHVMAHLRWVRMCLLVCPLEGVLQTTVCSNRKCNVRLNLLPWWSWFTEIRPVVLLLNDSDICWIFFSLSTDWNASSKTLPLVWNSFTFLQKNKSLSMSHSTQIHTQTESSWVAVTHLVLLWQLNFNSIFANFTKIILLSHLSD